MTTKTVQLSTPIKRNGGDVAELTLRKPATGELRGLKLTDVLQMDVNSLGVLLPRIAQPTITKADVDALDPADAMELGLAVLGFFEGKTVPAVTD
jgi:Phage tail assembly chaperone proteins, E, or 41 or 14